MLASRADTIALLRDLGAIVDEVRFPLAFEELMVRNGQLIAAEAYAVHRAYIEDEALPIDPWVRRRMLGGKAISAAADYIGRLAERATRRGATFADWMRGHDALLTPTLPDHRHARCGSRREQPRRCPVFTRAVNYLGTCGLSLPSVSPATDCRSPCSSHRRAVRRNNARAHRPGLPAEDALAPRGGRRCE